MGTSTNAAVIRISESKPDETIQLEIQVFNHELLRCDRTRNGVGVACPIILPITKPLIVGNIYRPPNKDNFLEIIKANFGKLDTDMKETHILSDFSINMYQSNKYMFVVIIPFLQGSFLAILKIITSFVQCMVLYNAQLLKSPTHVTQSTSTLIDHIAANFPSHKAVNDVRLSDHQLIFCTRKISFLKSSGTLEYLNFHSFKNYTLDSY